MFLMVLPLVLVLFMVKVLWVLRPPTLPPIKWIVVLIVVIFFLQLVGNIHIGFIHTKTVPILRLILEVSIVIVIAEVLEVFLVLVQPTSPPRNVRHI